MVAATDDWTSTAMKDGEVVAELLVRLKEAKVKPFLSANPTVTALRWGIRQPRSRSPRKEADSAINSRCSPSTPLSWSGGCGGSSSSPPSGYIDGFEATSRRINGSFPVGSRSKVLVTADLDFDVKRLQNKKDIASFNEQCIENKKNFKRMKIDLKNHSQNLAETEDHKVANCNFLLPDLNIMPCEETIDQLFDFGCGNNTIWN